MKSKEYERLQASATKFMNQLTPYRGESEPSITSMINALEQFIAASQPDSDKDIPVLNTTLDLPDETKEQPTKVVDTSSRKADLMTKLVTLEKKIKASREKIHTLTEGPAIPGGKNVNKQLSTLKTWLAKYEEQWRDTDELVRTM